MADGDRPRFDVYGTLLVLSFLLTAGAILVLNTELSSNWGFQLFGEKPTSQTWHNTQYRDLGKKYDVPYVEVRQQDIDEWAKIPGNAKDKMPIKDYDWPKEYRVDASAVDPRIGNMWAATEPDKADSPEVAKKKEELRAQLVLLLNAVPVDEPKKAEEKKPDETKKEETPTPPTDNKEKPPEKAPETKTENKTENK